MLVLLLSVLLQAPPHPLDDPLRLIEQCRERLAAVKGYQATLVRRRPGKAEETLLVKCRREPFALYWLWRKGDAGQELLYAAGANDGQVVAHHAGLRRTLSGVRRFDPESTEARRWGERSVAQDSLFHLCDRVRGQWAFARRHEGVLVDVRHGEVGDRRCWVVTVTCPAGDDGTFAFGRQKVFVDREQLLPLRCEEFGFPTAEHPAGEPLRSETYLDVRLDAPLLKVDFSPHNPRYRFSRL